MKTKVLALLLVLLMLVPCVLAACGDGEGTNSGTESGANSSTATEGSTASGDESSAAPEQDPTVLDADWNKVIIGSTTDLSGDFRFPGYDGSNPNASDVDINTLTVGYSTMELDRTGTYQWNKTVVADHTEKEDDDGNLVITIKLKEGLKFSDGTEVKAANYVAYILAFSSPVVRATANTGLAGQTFVGFNEFYYYGGEGTKDVTDKDGNVLVHPTKEFSGVRLLGDYEFSMTIAAPDFYPYYYAETYGAVSPYPLDLILGDDVEVKDDGDGAYLSEAWYAKADGSTDEAPKWVKVDHLNEMRWDTSKYAFSGPYMISEWDSSTKEATLKVNKNFAGNWEGQKPSIGTIVYTKVVQETQIDAVKNGQADVLAGLTGGDVVKAAIDLTLADSNFKEVHYDRAGYGKIQFDCDFSPAMFTEVRQAVSYIINKQEFASTFTGGYGAVVYGPYAVIMPQYKAVKNDLKLEPYDYSIANAKKVLEEGGWIYNSKGEAYVEGAEGVDSVRYKKLEGDEASEANINFASVENDDGITYKTVKVGDDYYMPLVLNWFGTEDNNVTSMLTTLLVGGDAPKQIGLVVRSSTGDFNALMGQLNRIPDFGYGGTPVYSMYNLATGWTSAVYDYAFNWSLDEMYFPYSVNKLYDPYDVDFPYNEHTGLTYEEAMEQSDGKLGMDYLSMAMVYSVKSGEEEEYNKWWKAYIERWNYLEPDIPLYGNVYYDLYNSKIEHFESSAYFGAASALLYSSVKKPA